MSRNAIATRLEISEPKLRQWEAVGILPSYHPEGGAEYMKRAELIAAARRGGLTLRRIQDALLAVAAEVVLSKGADK